MVRGGEGIGWLVRAGRELLPISIAYFTLRTVRYICE